MFSTDRQYPHVEPGRPAESLRFTLVTLDVILTDFHKLEAAEAAANQGTDECLICLSTACFSISKCLC